MTSLSITPLRTDKVKVLRPPPITRALRFPATAGTLALSLAATIAWWRGVDCSPLFADAHVAAGQLHRLLTSALLHRDPLHLAFNFYWLWTFGTLIERHLGPWRTAGLFALLAAGSNAAEMTFLTGGVGLSGVGYGLFGFLWLFWKRPPADDERFADAVDQKTEAVFVLWFFACILLSIIDILPVANIAHGVGALLGVVVAWTMMMKRNRGDAETRKTNAEKKKWNWRGAAPAGATITFVLAAVFARPFVNLAPHRGEQEASLGYDALVAQHDARALRWSRAATRMNPTVASWWFNRAIAEDRLGRLDAALISYNNAARLAPANASYRTARDRMHDYLAGTTAITSAEP